MEEAIEAFKKLTPKAEALKKSMTIISDRIELSGHKFGLRLANERNHRGLTMGSAIVQKKEFERWECPGPSKLATVEAKERGYLTRMTVLPPTNSLLDELLMPIMAPIMAPVTAPVSIKSKERRIRKILSKHARRRHWFIRFINSL